MMVGRLRSFWEGNFSGAMLNFRWVYKKEAAGVPKNLASALRTVIVEKSLLSMNVRTSYDSTYHFVFYSDSSLTSWVKPLAEIDSPKQSAIAIAGKLYTDFFFSFVQFLQVQDQAKHPTKIRNKNI